MSDVTAIRDCVQFNCHVSDAGFARDYTMCVYLLKMREYFRWERGLGFHETLPGAALGAWLVERETYWDSLEDAAYRVPAGAADVYDAQSVNQALGPRFHYDAGVGVFGKPHFVLGEVRAREYRDGAEVILVERELARDLSAPPALSQGTRVVVRIESLRRAVWEVVQDWSWRRPAGAMARLIGLLEAQRAPSRAVGPIADTQLERVVAHELGEIGAGRLLGQDWPRMLMDLSGTPAELTARAVRDHLADALVTLPALIEARDWPGLHFYFAMLRGVRRALTPALAAAYERACTAADMAPLTALVDAEHWLAAGRRLLAAWHQAGPAATASGPRARMPELAALAQTGPE